MEEQDWLYEIFKKEDLKITDKQAKILEAAIEIFSEKGFAATSTSEIAKKAGVAEGTIFRHYKTKKDLLIAIVSPTIFRTASNFFAKNFAKEVFDIEYESYEDFLKAMIKNRFEFVRKHLPLLRIFLQEVAFHEELREQFKTVYLKQVHQKFIKIIEHFQEKNELVALPPKTIIRFSMSNIVALMMTRFLILPNDEWDMEKEIDDTVRFIAKGLKVE